MFNHKKSDATKHSLSNERRLESVKLKTQHNKVQQNLIKSALAEIDSGKAINKRIVFDLEDEDEIVKDDNGFARGFNNKDKKQLFADSDDDNERTSGSKGYDNGEDAFSIKPQFEGKKGQELLELQSRFKSDERFQLDKRFIQSDSDDVDSAKEELGTALESMDVVAEKEKNFEILQSVLGMQFPTQPMNKKLSKHRAIKDTSKLHYDPTREDAENFEIKRQSNSETSTSKKKKQKMTNSEPVALPEVSKEKFFKVETNLKDVFNKASETGKFSFLKEFGHDDNSKKEDELNNDYFAEKVDQIKSSSFGKNAFKYDSSDDEDENTTKEPSSHKSIPELPEQPQQNRLTYNWKFFLSEDDPRLKEGIQYFRRRGTDEEIEEWWRVTRNSMLDIIQAKRKVFKRRTNVNRRLGKRRK